MCCEKICYVFSARFIVFLGELILTVILLRYYKHSEIEKNLSGKKGL